MRKSLKIVGIVLLCLLVTWIIIVAIDCIRLKNTERGTQPFITISSKNYDKENRNGEILQE